MKEIAFFIGGCRSGKSGYALQLANSLSRQNKFFFATCIPADQEMEDRVRKHQSERGSDWESIEVPINLPSAILDYNKKADIILIDCLTLWISNILMNSRELKVVEAYVDQLTDALCKADCHVYIVSNGVGTGIVPENVLARRFRDEAGRVNQRVAGIADKVFLMVAGIPVPIKNGMPIP